MLRYRNLVVFGALSLACGALVSTAVAADPPYVTAAVQNPARTPQLMKRDADRKPADLITFAGIKPGDKLAELTPEKGYDGYFTQVLAKVVGPRGTVYAYVPLRGWRDIEAMRLDEKKQRDSGKPPVADSLDPLLALQHTTDYKNVVSIESMMFSADGDCQSPKIYATNCFGLPEQVDAVFTGAGYHELHNKVNGPMNTDPVDMVMLNKAIFREMKPGGVYVVSDYAAAKGAGVTQTATLNRIEADAVKSEIVAAGFTFEAQSDVLANAGDDLNEPAAGDKASRFVLRFRKPASASPETRRYPISVFGNYDGNTYSASGARADFFHADGTYQEFGLNEMQIMHNYFDADGDVCLYHESPPEQEGFVICHTFGPQRARMKLGDSIKNPNGTTSTMRKGYIYPQAPPAGQQQQARPAAQ